MPKNKWLENKIRMEKINKCEDGVNVAQQTLQFVGDGSNPISSHNKFKIRKGEFKDFVHLLRKHHYKSDNIGGSISYHLVLKQGVLTIGGSIIGKMRHTNNYDDKAVEIRRMVLDPRCPKNTASYFLSKIIWWLKNNTDTSVVYTFADKTVGHKGTCYKASNFKFVKETKKSKYVIWNGKRYHCRSLTINRPYSYKLREAIKDGKAEIVTGKNKILFKYVIKR